MMRLLGFGSAEVGPRALTCARPNECSLAAAAAFRRGCKLAYYAAMTA